MPQRRFRDWTITIPEPVEDGDVLALKVVAVAGRNDDWAAYTAPSGWTDEDAADHGLRLCEETARLLFPVMVATGRNWRR